MDSAPPPTPVSEPGKTHLFVASDLHLGGHPPLMRNPESFASFVDALPTRSDPDETLHLVLAGDFVDFLALPPHSDFSSDPADAVARLAPLLAADSIYAPLLDSLARHVAAGHRLTVLVGNHDLELALPDVQRTLLTRLCADRRQVAFVDDGSAFRLGSVVIEHGNDCDAANANDWDGIRHLRSTRSRGLDTDRAVRVSAGSRLVTEVVNPLRQEYPFLPLLQPEGLLVVLLALALEPRLLTNLPAIRRVLHAGWLANATPGPRAGAMSAPVLAPDAQDEDLHEVYGDVYRSLTTPPDGAMGVASWSRQWLVPDDDSLSSLLRSGRTVPPLRVRQLRVVLKRLLRSDTSERLDGPTGQCGELAHRILRKNADIDAVVMGHTHLARRVEYERGCYLNSGAWIDRLRIPPDALEDGKRSTTHVLS